MCNEQQVYVKAEHLVVAKGDCFGYYSRGSEENCPAVVSRRVYVTGRDDGRGWVGCRALTCCSPRHFLICVCYEGRAHYGSIK